MKSISYIMCILVILYAMTGCKLADNGLSGDISNGSGGGVTEPAADPVPVVVEKDVFFLFQDNTSKEYVYQLHYDSTAATASSVTVVNGAEVSVTGDVRTMSLMTDGKMLIGGTGGTTLPIYSSSLTTSGSIDVSSGGGSAIANSHASCSLPNGNLIVAEEAVAVGNLLNEYDSSGTFLRTVYTGVLTDHGAISQCVAVSNTQLVFIEAKAWALTDNYLISSVFSGGSWSTSQSIQMTTYDPGNGTNLWGFVVHTDGNIYMPTFRRSGASIKKMIKCPLTNISNGSCVAVGDDIPNSGSASTTWARAIVQLPDSNDMLLFLSKEVYHYNYATGVYTQVLDLATDLTGVTIDTVRAAIQAPKP